MNKKFKHSSETISLDLPYETILTLRTLAQRDEMTFEDYLIKIIKEYMELERCYINWMNK